MTHLAPRSAPAATVRASRPDGRATPATHLIRAACAVVRGTPQNGGADAVCRATWPGDERSEILLRAATSPATLSGAGWADTLATPAVHDFVSGLGPSSASAALFRAAGVSVDLSGRGSVMIPSMAIVPLGAFTADGAAIRVAAMAVDGPVLEPYALKVIVSFTREISEHGSFEAVVRATLSEATSAALDAVLFGTAAATSVQPAGLRNGAASVTAAAAGVDAMAADLGGLAEAVAGVAGDRIAFIAAPAEAVKIRLRAPDFGFPLYASAALPANTVVAIALPALVTAADPVPELSLRNAALLHMEDANALAIGAAGPTLATPTRSMFQTDTLALRLILRASWGLRADPDDAVAVASNVAW